MATPGQGEDRAPRRRARGRAVAIGAAALLLAAVAGALAFQELTGYSLRLLALHYVRPLRALSREKVPPSEAEIYEWRGLRAPPARFVDREGKELGFEAFRGKWVFFEAGQTTCLPSEEMARSLSGIARQLQDQPFLFVHEYYEEPGSTWDDVGLGVHFAFHGVQVRPADEGIFFARGPVRTFFDFYPTCLLLNPKGVVVWTGSIVPDAALRRLLPEKIGRGVRFPDGFAASDPLRAREEEAARLAHARKWPEAAKAWREVDAALPDDPESWLAPVWAAGLLPPGEGAALAGKRADASVPGSPRFLHLLAAKAAALASTRRGDAAVLYGRLAEAYPGSIRVRSALLPLEKSPAAFTEAETALLEKSPADAARVAAAYAREAQDDPRARPLFLDLPRAYRWHAAAYLFRHGENDEAARVLREAEGAIDPATQDRQTLGMACLRHAAIGDWEGAKGFGDRLHAITPANALGPVVDLLAALRTGDDAARAAAAQALLDFQTNRPAYLLGQAVQRGETEIDAAAVIPLLYDPNRQVGLLWAALALEAKGRPAEAWRAETAGLDSFLPVDPEYPFYASIRHSLSPQAPPEPAP